MRIARKVDGLDFDDNRAWGPLLTAAFDGTAGLAVNALSGRSLFIFPRVPIS